MSKVSYDYEWVFPYIFKFTFTFKVSVVSLLSLGTDEPFDKVAEELYAACRCTRDI
jgi:hypothetical protein